MIMSAPTFTFPEILTATGGKHLGGPVPATIAGVSTDTRQISGGACFVALAGERFDAHTFLAAAAGAGAACAIVSRRWSASAGVAVQEAAARMALVAVPDTLVALGALAHFHRRRFGLPVVAVTGSNGKTTTKEMVAAVLGTQGTVLKTEGNLNNEVGVPLTLFGLGPGHALAVIEMGMNHAGEIGRLAAIAEPAVGIVTNAAAVHIEGLGSVDAVADAKGELYRGLPRDGVAVANADDARMLRQARASGRKLVTFGRDKGADVWVAEAASRGADGQMVRLSLRGEKLKIALPLLGAHNAVNAAAAAAAGMVLGYGGAEIQRGLESVKTVGRRLRLERLPGGPTLIDDCYNANPGSMAAALTTLVDLARGEGKRPVAVLGDMLELGPVEAESHRALGEAAARAGVGLLALFGPRSQAGLAPARAGGIGGDATFHTEDMGALTGWVRARVGPGDVVLVKASRGMKLERLVEAIAGGPAHERAKA
jgi:UDP-N-acetylmuramoyl-tripeptide--D-alanyl-D-alanine ligase